MGPLARSFREVHYLTAPPDVGALRRLARELALEQSASDADCGRVELVATELGTNTLRHAQPPGYMLLQPLTLPHCRGVEILAVDHGPGIRDLAGVLAGLPGRRFDLNAQAEGPRCLGVGLSAVRRLASEFDIHSQRDRGTVVLARIFFEPPARALGFRAGTVSVPVMGEQQNGDAWAFVAQPTGCAALVADGLGHGPLAARASVAAAAVFHRAGVLDPESYFQAAHEALRGTRGAAVSLCCIFPGQHRLVFAGVGNVEGRIHLTSRSVGLAPRSGTLGMNPQAPRIELRELAWEPGAILVLHSDGLRHHYDLAAYGDLRQHDPTVIAALLHRDLARARDDATVMVVQDMRAAPR